MWPIWPTVEAAMALPPPPIDVRAAGRQADITITLWPVASPNLAFTRSTADHGGNGSMVGTA